MGSVPINKYSKSLTKVTNNSWKTQEGLEPLSYRKQGHITSSKIDNSSFWYLHRGQIISTVVIKFKPEWILDVGGGTGYVASQLSIKGVNTVVLEPHPEGAKIALELNKCQVINASLSQCGFIPDSIPSIGLFDVLEHIEDDQEFIDQCYHLLENAGQIYITVPAYNWLYSFFDRDAGHFRRYNMRSIKKILKNSNFKIVYSSHFFWFLPLIILITRKTFVKIFFLKKPKSGHIKKSSLLGYILSKILAIELWLIKKGKKILFGSSLIIVARK